MLEFMLDQYKEERDTESFEQAYFDLMSFEEQAKLEIGKAFASAYMVLPSTYFNAITNRIKNYTVNSKKRISGFKDKMEKLEANYNSIKGDFNDEVSILLNVTGFTAAFIKNGRYTTTPIADLKDDQDLIKDLIDYSKVTAKNYVDLVTKNLPSYVVDDKKPRHPLADFPDKWIGKKDLLYNTTIILNDPWSNNPALSNAAQSAKVELVYGNTNKYQKLAGLKSMAARPFGLKSSEVSNLVTYLKEKIETIDDLIDTFNDINDDVIRSSKSFDKVLKIALKKNKDTVRKEVSKQIVDYQKNLLDNVVHPVSNGVKRELDLINHYLQLLGQINRSIVVNSKKDD